MRFRLMPDCSSFAARRVRMARLYSSCRFMTMSSAGPGFLHGGAIAGLLEFAAFMALRQALGDRIATMKPINVTVDYMRAGQPRDTFAAANVERLGGRIANVEALGVAEGPRQPIAAAQMNFLLIRD